MPKVTIVVREPAKLKPDFSLDFNLPNVPSPGDYISIQRPEHEGLWTEDVIVRHVWYVLSHPEKSAITTGEPKVGTVKDIMIECEIALSPYSSDSWRRNAEAASERGAAVEEFEVARFAVRESDVGRK